MSKTRIPKFKPKKLSRSSNEARPSYMVRGRIWIEINGEFFMGWGRVKLLEHIDELGSVAAAARSMGLGYRNAWLWVDAMNRLSPNPLVEKTTGGVGGGGARLTEEGRKAVRKYKELRAKFQDFFPKGG